MNAKISIAVLVAFSFTFVSLIIFTNLVFSDPFESNKNNIFFLKEFDPNEKKVFLFGSSHVVFINMTHIIERVSNVNPEYVVYNLAHVNDTPIFRYQMLPEILSLKPDIVFYGISYQSFNTKPAETNQFLTLSQLLGDKINVIPKNPKRETLHMIRDFLNDTEMFSVPAKDITPPNAPFGAFQKDRMIILNDNELKREAQTSNYEILITPISENVEIKYFKEILSDLYENDIPVVIFKAPLHRYYHDIVPETEKIALDSLLDDISKEFNIKIYDFSEKYSDMPIWSDTSHIAYNDKSLIYSNDIAKMILTEIEE